MKRQDVVHLQLKLRRLIVALFTFISVVTFSASAIDAQGFRVETKSPPSITEAGTFVSLNGRFSFALPQTVSGFSLLTLPTPVGEAKGDLYQWRMWEGSFYAGFGDATQPVDDPETSKRVFAQARDEMVKSFAPHGIKLVSERPIQLDKHPGMELRFEGFNGFTIRRLYAVSRRLYQTMVIVKTEQRVFEAAIMNVLDSFKLLSESEVATARKEKAAAAEPKPLPQEPVAPKAASDLEDDGLHGPVKTLFRETQDPSATSPRKPVMKEYFNEQGNQTREEMYDYKGNLLLITLYGYIDGARVSRSDAIQQEYNPPPISRPASAGAATPKADPRYAAKYTYEYDDKKRRTEMSIFGNDGNLSMRYVYKYAGRQVEEWVYADGKLNQHYRMTLDEQGNEIERTSLKTFPGSDESKYAYVYEFDSHGNWIKKNTSEWVTEKGRSFYQSSSTQYRTITYYE